MTTKKSKVSNKKNPFKNCGIDLYYLYDNPDKSFIKLPIIDLANIIDSICSSQEDFFYISEIIQKNTDDSFSELSSNDIIYNYLINYNDIHKILLKILIKEMKKKEEKIVEIVNKDLTGRGKKPNIAKLFKKIKNCITDEYNTYGLGGITVGRFLNNFDTGCFKEESFILSYFDELA